jgi:hypothetical protein
MAKKKAVSPAIELLQMVWDHCNRGTGFSYERLNHAMSAALELAIGSGFRFATGDFLTTSESFRFGYWGGADNGGFAESFYATAVKVDNMSAIQAFEAWKGRGPLIVDDVACEQYGRWSHGGGKRKKGRACVGCRFPWNGETVTVTSMPRGDAPLVACSYEKTDDGRQGKILHRYKITAADIQADRAERKERDSLLARAMATVDPGRIGLRLRVETREELYRVPLVKMQKVVEAMEAEDKR